jgi:hypothetical protein
VSRGTNHIRDDGVELHLVAVAVTKVSNYFFTYVLSCIFVGGIIGSTNKLSCILCTINCFLTNYLSTFAPCVVAGGTGHIRVDGMELCCASRH